MSYRRLPGDALVLADQAVVGERVGADDALQRALEDSVASRWCTVAGGDMKKKRTRKAKRPVVAVAHPSYQPSVAELREDQGIKGAFDQAVDALTKPIEVKYVKPKRTR